MLKDLIDTSRLYNLHSHTEFCDGRATMEAFAREAVKLGYDLYGFSPHSPVPIESPCNMHRDNVERYVAEVSRINSEYGDKCRFLAGMEVDYLGELWGPASDYIASLPLDYRIGSVHFVQTPDKSRFVDCDGSHERFAGYLEKYFDNDLRYVVESYFNSMSQMIDKGSFDIVGHLDKIAENASSVDPEIENQPWFIDKINSLIDQIAETDLIVEINTKMFAQRNRLFPSPRYWKRLVDAKIPVTFNSDAHVPALITASRDEVIEMFNTITHQS
ncbi:MAG: histidinol-phosphatase [Muribaculaceae bacterium]|nr:histidinol-phosphatase [Muribaculaceae bacterium]